MSEAPSWLKPDTIPRSAEQVRQHYDQVSDSYDEFVAAGGYEAPKIMAALYADLVAKNEQNPSEQRVLDAGCGTGLLGLALAKHGFSNIDGCDVSQNMLDEAATKQVYTNLGSCDLLAPLEWQNGEFSAVCYCGVLSRFDQEQIEAILKESARILSENGLLIFSMRVDQLESFNLPHYLARQSNIALAASSPAYPYLPGIPGYENVEVKYIALKKLQAAN